MPQIICAGETVILKESLLLEELYLLTHGTIGTTFMVELTNPIEMNVWIVMLLVVKNTTSSIVTVVMVYQKMI
jgi:hypothetical protein